MGAGEFLSFAQKLADKASEVVLAGFRASDQQTRNKAEHGGFDPQTESDRLGEKVLRAEIEARFPEHGIEGEEFPEKPSSCGLRWILDPIDGTRYFMAGMAGWGSLIALYEGERAVLGLADFPHLGLRFWGDGKTSFKNGTPIKTRRGVPLERAFLATTTPALFRGAAAAAFATLSQKTLETLFGGNCLAYCLLAEGRLDLVVEDQLKPVDILPLVPIIEGAGGVVSDWRGAAAGGAQALASANAELHQAASAILKMGAE